MEGGVGEVEATRPWQQLQQPDEGGESGLEGQGGCGAYRTNYRIIPFLVTNVISYVILENTMVIM